MLTLSTPALPLLRFTARKASCINFRLILPVNEWCLIFNGPTIVNFPIFFRSSICRSHLTPVPWRVFLNRMKDCPKKAGLQRMALLRLGLTVLMVRGFDVSFRWVSL